MKPGRLTCYFPDNEKRPNPFRSTSVFRLPRKAPQPSIAQLWRRLAVAEKRLYASFSLSSSASMVFWSSGVSLRMPIPVYPRWWRRSRQSNRGLPKVAAILVPAAVQDRIGSNTVPESSMLRPRLQGCEPQQLARQQEGDLAVAGGGY